MTRKQVLVTGVTAIALSSVAGIAWVSRLRQNGSGAELPGGGAEYRATPFEVLAFPYDPPPKRVPGTPAPPRPDPFPAEVRALDGAKISVTGYMAPLTMNAGRIDSFYLSRGVFQCCYADAPKITDYIRVTMAPGQFAPNADLVQVKGLLDVGEERNSIGFVESVYRLKAEAVTLVEIEGSGWAEVVAWGVGGLLFLALFGPVGVRLLKTLQERYRVAPAVRNDALNG